MTCGSLDVAWISLQAGGGLVQMTEEEEGIGNWLEMISQGMFQKVLVSQWEDVSSCFHSLHVVSLSGWQKLSPLVSFFR